MPYTGTVPYPLHAALTCANTSEDSSKGRDMGLWFDYMDIVIRIMCIYYVLTLSVDDDTPFALSHPSSCCVLAFHTKPNQSKSAVCLSVLSSHVLS